MRYLRSQIRRIETMRARSRGRCRARWQRLPSPGTDGGIFK